LYSSQIIFVNNIVIKKIKKLKTYYRTHILSTECVQFDYRVFRRHIYARSEQPVDFQLAVTELQNCIAVVGAVSVESAESFLLGVSVATTPFL
jgi:hypothetical protein